MRTWTVGALLLALVATGLGGCSREITGPVVVLRLATPDRAVDPSGELVQHFADEVSRRSRETVRIEPVWDVTPDDVVHRWDQAVAGGVADGTWDLGLVPGRAWDELGVSSLRALNTPFLVTSTEALEVVLEGELREELLAGLGAAGVVGLDLFPDALRHPFGYTEPLLGPEDYAGETIRTPASATVERLFETLGAETTDAPLDSTSQRGAESDYAFSQAPVATGNVTFFPKTEVLAAGAEVRDHLRPDQWAVLVDAAAATRAWAFAEQPSDVERAEQFCAQGGSVVAATAAQLGALEAAAAPVTAWLRRDPGTARLVDAIGEAVRGVEAASPPASCPTSPSGDVDPELASLNGIYRARLTARQLRAAGLRPDVVRENAARYTWVLEDGTWTYDAQAGHFIRRPRDTGRFTYRDGVFTFFFDDGESMTSRLEIDERGSIHFRDVRSSAPEDQRGLAASFRHWSRIGALPD